MAASSMPQRTKVRTRNMTEECCWNETGEDCDFTEYGITKENINEESQNEIGVHIGSWGVGTSEQTHALPMWPTNFKNT